MLHSIQPLRIHYFIQTPVVFWCNSFFLFLKCLLASNLTLFTLSTMLWFGSCTHCILTCFFWFKNSKHSPSSHGSCCFNSQRPRLPLAEVLMLSWMLYQALFMSSLSFKFSKTAILFVICCTSNHAAIWPPSPVCIRSYKVDSFLYSTLSKTNGHCSEISPTRCNNCVFILRNGFSLHVSGDNLTHHQEYICCIWPQVSRLT